MQDVAVPVQDAFEEELGFLQHGLAQVVVEVVGARGVGPPRFHAAPDSAPSPREQTHYGHRVFVAAAGALGLIAVRESGRQ